MRPDVFLLPEHAPGHGLGHFARACNLAAALGARALIHLPSDILPSRRTSLQAFAHARGVSQQVTAELPQAAGPASPALFVLDKRSVSQSEVEAYTDRGFVVGIDVAGPGRTRCDYLIDILPRIEGGTANRRDVRLLDMPGAPQVEAEPPQRVLVTFGGDDPGRLTERVVEILLSVGIFPAERIAVLPPALAEVPPAVPEGVELLEPPVDPAETLGRFSHVVTSFGLTAIEAAWLGAEVVLVNLSSYHERLSNAVGFRSAGVGAPSARRLRRRLAGGGGAEAVREALAGAEAISLSEEISDLHLPAVASCPACDSPRREVVARFEKRTYVRCPVCGMVYLLGFDEPRAYDEGYFFEEYRAQYGKTYLEDWPHIEAMARGRLELIGRVLDGRHRRRGGAAGAGLPLLVDLGCAYGPFLKAAAERGYDSIGIDASEAAVSYVRRELGLEAYDVSLEELSEAAHRPARMSAGSAEVVTMWYVIEHLPGLGEVLRAVRDILVDGGVFAFSTPNLGGISGSTHLTGFLDQSPPDHYTVWTPAIARRVLERYGFRVAAVRVTGHHPERFPLLGSLARRSGLVYRVVAAVSRLLRLGDTFEVYAVKKPDRVVIEPGQRTTLEDETR